MKKLFYVMLAACAVAACSPKEAIVDVVPASSAPKTFKATIDGDATRVYQDGLNLYWNANDRVGVYAMSNAYDLYLFAGETGAKAGELVLSVADETGTVELPYNYAVFPSGLTSGISDDGIISVIVNPNQTPAEFGCIDTHYSNLMVARSADNTLNFKNACGYLKLTLFSEEPVEIGDIDLYSQSNQAMSGQFTLDFDVNDLPVLAPDYNGTVYAYAFTNYYAEFGEKLIVDENGVDVYFVLPPAVYEGGFEVVMYEEYDENSDDDPVVIASATISSDVTIYRNKITSMPALEVSASAGVEATVLALDIDEVYGDVSAYGLDHTNSFAIVMWGTDIAAGTLGVWDYDMVDYYGLELCAQYNNYTLPDDAIDEINEDYFATYVSSLTPGSAYVLIVVLENAAGESAIFYDIYETEELDMPEYPEDLDVPVIFNEDFEEGCEGWSLYDEDGDGFNWEWFGPEDNMSAHGGDGLLASASYDNDNGVALSPDNWAVSPAIELTEGNFLSFWVAGQDLSYYAENFEVYIKTEEPGDSMSAGDDEPILVYTIGDEGYDQIMATESSRIFYRFVLDLSAYDGQTVYVAFRHCDVTDMFWLNLDDVVVTEGNPIDFDAAPKAAVKAAKAPKKAPFEVRKSFEASDKFEVSSMPGAKTIARTVAEKVVR